MLFMTIILAMVDPDLFRSILAPRATAQGSQVLPAKNVLTTYRSKSMLKCDVIQCSRKRTLSTYAFGDWAGSQKNVIRTDSRVREEGAGLLRGGSGGFLPGGSFGCCSFPVELCLPVRLWNPINLLSSLLRSLPRLWL